MEKDQWRYLIWKAVVVVDRVLISLRFQQGMSVDDVRIIVTISIAFPDDGAWKRFHKQLQHFPTVVCAKVREGDKRIVRIKEGEPKGRHIVIVDDLVQSGGTLIECQKVLAAHGASKISAYVTHGIFPNKSWERFGHDNGGNPESAFTYFWITDSCPLTVKEVMHRPPFELSGAYLAELWGVFEGLRLARRLNFKAVELHVDSAIVVLAICSTGSGSMCGRSLVEKIRRLLHLDREVVVRHSYHEANQ
ncbi:ribose-phosphate pyrophosphokinase mitochondrial-like [Trifolium pratense]|uniref:Ribose-phosphate pyrophosphokinase mitochondrial-like n=1 Tax=Trifolium pratense TaxID=57577 RepID=A0A2K3P499_TRIPR|nr:ribose-phosphate pyrophosphokinase mitochondrial-like [Trifolium pratense]